MWVSEGQMKARGHDMYFTIGETVGGVTWDYLNFVLGLARREFSDGSEDRLLGSPSTVRVGRHSLLVRV